jgi:ubiquinone biosynthesis protein COQ9|tara:strand:+ start:728 stop:1324 length:597 start_codon:yes stop_codon:yes gene_type:complete
MEINRNKILLRLLKNITEYEDFDDALLSTLSQLKINQDKFYDIKQDLLPKGLSSLMKELNLIINQTIDKEQKPSRFKNYKINEKIKYFVIRRLMVFQNLVDKRKFFKKILKPNLIVSSNKTLFKIADEIWFLAGDKSTDYNYYTKRIILMNIYAITFSFFVFDNSKDLERTKKFLDKEISAVLKFGNLKNKLKKNIKF